MATITTRSGKGSALTHTELDNNFTNLNSDKLEVTTAGTTYLAKAGGTMTGAIVFAGAQATATTATPNIVLLTDSTSSNSITTAATPNSVKTAYNLANAALPLTGGALTGNVSLTVNNSTIGFSVQQSGTGAALRILQAGTGDALLVEDVASDTTPFKIDASGNTTIGGTLNKVTITAPATGSTLTIADGKTLTASNTLTLTGTDDSSVVFGGGGTVAYTGGKLSQFATTTSAELASVINDETGSGDLVFATSPSLTTSVLTDSTSFNVFNTTATTLNAFGASTTLTIGGTPTTAITHNYSTNATASGSTKTVNIATGGVAGSTATVNIAPLDGAGITTIGNNLTVRGTLATSSNSSAASWTTNGISLDSAGATFTNSTGTGTITTQVSNSFGTPTFASTSAVTLTNAANIYISAAPTAGTNTAITDSWAIYSAGGETRFDGAMSLTGGVSPRRGPITSLSTLIGGSAYTNGTYSNVVLTGGRGAGATATIVVSGGIVTTVTLTREGSYFQAGDVLSATSVVSGFGNGTGTGFTITVASVRSVALQMNQNASRIRLGSSNTSVAAGTELGSILFGCQDTDTGGRGDKVRLIAAAEGTTGGGQLQIWTSTAGGEPTLGFLFGGNNDFRLYNDSGTFYHAFSNAPTANRTITLPDGNVTLTAGTTAITGGNLSQFASTTSAQLANVISDETGTGVLVFANAPTLVTPVIGAASATSINKVAITAPATSATLTVADGKTLTASNTLTLTGTDSSSVAFGAGGTVAYDGPSFRATAPGNQTVTSLSTTKITLTTEIWDTNSAYDAANSRFQPATAGYYLAICNVLYTAAGSPLARIYKNGALWAASSDYSAPITTTVFLNGSTDYLEVYNLQASPQNNTISSDSFFTATLLRRS